jgi:hypothetical protein
MKLEKLYKKISLEEIRYISVDEFAIKTMKRQAYGFRDIVYFKLRLYHLNEQRYAFVG